MRRNSRILAAGAAAALAVAGGGAAIAATSGGDPQAESEAAVADAAEQLGVTPAKLTDALQEALKNRVDAAVEDGRLTEERAQELKERIDAGEVPLLGMGHRGGHHRGPGPGFDEAASYLGVPEADLREELQSGTTLAELAEEKGRSVDGLVDAMLAPAKERLDAEVEDGSLTRAQADERLAELRERVQAIVNGERPAHPGRGHRHFNGPGAGAGLAPPLEDEGA